MRFPLRRVLLGFAVGAAAGWAGGLLRRPTSAPEGSSADEALHLPQEEFGSPAGEEPAVEGAEEIAQEPTAPAAAYETPEPEQTPEPEPEEPHETPSPRKAVAPAVKRPPGSRKTRAAAAEGHDGASEPATAPEAGQEQVKPRRTRAAKKTVADPHVDAAAALREGHAAATERLSDAEAEATPPPDLGPARRRRRPAAGT